MLYLKTKLRQFKWLWRNRREVASFQATNNAEIFSRIYAENVWGKTLNIERQRPFFSGSGSHDVQVVSRYVDAVSRWAQSIDAPLSAMDIGCGDFNIGSALLSHFSRYTAADVVPELIQHNREEWQDAGVDFLVLDITSDIIPYADVLLVREVFQHLSNADIIHALQNIQGSCKYLILTESRPAGPEFVPNLDKPTGVGTRSQFGSGVNVLCPPFSLECQSINLILSQPRGDRRLDTVVYEMV